MRNNPKVSGFCGGNVPEGFDTEQPDVDSVDGVDVDDVDPGEDWEDDGSDDDSFEDDVDADDTDDGDAVKRYTVKVDGEELEVDEDELIAGYQRQKDYTKKTQQLAERAKQLQSAEALAKMLAKDPHKTIMDLAAQVGLDLSGGKGKQGSDDDWDSWDDDDSSSEDPKYAALRAEVEQLKMERAEQKLDAELGALEKEYGEYDREGLIAFANSRGIYDLEAAFKAWRFDQLLAEKEQEAKNSKRVEKKRAAKKVQPASVKNRGSVSKPVPSKNLSTREAYLLAKQEHGVA